MQMDFEAQNSTHFLYAAAAGLFTIHCHDDHLTRVVIVYIIQKIPFFAPLLYSNFCFSLIPPSFFFLEAEQHIDMLLLRTNSNAQSKRSFNYARKNTLLRATKQRGIDDHRLSSFAAHSNHENKSFRILFSSIHYSFKVFHRKLTRQKATEAASKQKT